MQRLPKTSAYLVGMLLAFTLSGCTNPVSSVEPISSIELGEPGPSDPGNNVGDIVVVEPVEDELAELEIEDQAGFGFEVVVEEVRLSRGDGFLVITSQEGETLGYSVVTPDSQPVVVLLTSRISTNRELIGELFLDNGDGVFSRDSDFPIRDDEGELVREDFSFTLSE